MYWPLLNMYSENFGFGLGGFIIRRTFKKRMKGLSRYEACEAVWSPQPSAQETLREALLPFAHAALT